MLSPYINLVCPNYLHVNMVSLHNNYLGLMSNFQQMRKELFEGSSSIEDVSCYKFLPDLLTFKGPFTNWLESTIIALLNEADNFYRSFITRFIATDKFQYVKHSPALKP